MEVAVHDRDRQAGRVEFVDDAGELRDQLIQVGRLVGGELDARQQPSDLSDQVLR
jgi:hypothetical protein